MPQNLRANRENQCDGDGQDETRTMPTGNQAAETSTEGAAQGAGVQPAGDWAIFISFLAKINAGPFQFMAK